MESLSLYGRSETGTWRKGYFTGDSNCHVEEGFGNGATPSLYRLCEGNLEEGLLY